MKKTISLSLTAILVLIISVVSLANNENIDTNTTKYEDQLKEQSQYKNNSSRIIVSYNPNDKDELDIAYENMLTRENYIVDLVSELSTTTSTFENWEYNLNYLLENYDELKIAKNINMQYVDTYIETYISLKEIQEMPDENVNSLPMSRSTYSRDDAVSYAKKYYLNYNSSYPDWGTDCANFVSQAIHAGGKSMKGNDSTNDGSAWEKNWFSSGTAQSTTKVSPSWRGANAFRYYWQKNAAKYKRFSSYGTSAWEYGYRGDAVSFLNSNGAAYHTLIIVSYDDGLICACHSSSSFTRKLKDYKGEFIIFDMYN